MFNTLRNIALIPARSGSQRIPHKNIYKINNHPLIAYSIQSAINSKAFDEVVCITDSEEYAQIARKYGADVPKLRPKYTAKSTSKDFDWIIWILKFLKQQGRCFDTFSILRPTNPLRTEKTIIRAFKQFTQARVDIDSLRAIEETSQHPGKMWILNGELMDPLIKKKINGAYWHSNQTKVLPKFYVQNASLEISFTKNIFQKNSISGERVAPFITQKYEGFDINYPEDLYILDYILNNKLATLPKIKH